MSRFTKQLENDKYIAYGHDIVLGYFFDVFSAPIDGERELIISESSMLTRMDRGKMINLMDLFNLPESQIEQVALDLPIS